MNHNPKKLVVTVLLAGMLVFGNGLVLWAQPDPSSTAAQGIAPEGAENIVCQAEMELYLQGELKSYRAWLEQHFQNKSSTASLLDSALGRYSQFREGAYKHYEKYFPHQGALQLTEGLEPGACRKMIEDATATARRLLESKARSTSAVKKTTALIGKYQEINGKLRLLNQTFLTMKAYLTTFSDKLPCYVSKACNKS